MALEQRTFPQCLNIVWGHDGKLRGAAYYEQHQIVDGDTIISARQGDAQPVALLAGQPGIDLTQIIGQVGADALALAERTDAERRAVAEQLAAAQEQIKQLTAERDGYAAQVTAAQADAAVAQEQIAALTAQIAQMTP